MASARILPMTLQESDPAALLTRLPPGPGRFLLESGPMGPAEVRRCSFAGAEPFMTLVVRGRECIVHEEGRTRVLEGDPLVVLQSLLNRCRVKAKDGFPGFPGGAVGYFAYEQGRVIERLPETPAADLGLPDMVFGFYDVVLMIDHTSGETALLLGPPDGREAAAMSKARRWAAALKRAAPAPVPRAVAAGPVVSSMTRQVYRRAVQTALDYIGAGDIYQVNLAQRFSALYTGTGWDLYRRLRALFPAPFAAFLEMGSWQVVSGSPERFITVEGRKIETRPIKGTRPRSADPELDRALAAELLASEKDAAELVMIVDLQRNDLGRICEYGTVTVPSLRHLEQTPNVWHTVASVVGRLRPDADTASILRATFPGGSITGAPKVRAMQIIAELEPVRRDVYTGAIGYIGFDGRLDLNIAIRTAVVKDGQVHFHAGGGIVADSDPELEYHETLAKGSGIARALGVSLDGLP
ncbi:MAG TPA: aminodeoxychorismate synthase component I [Symbiobacteriaceae bacterium]|nr:aminodeoxychorismate synthase component I [Symbiobacteriaceae bacterium]